LLPVHEYINYITDEDRKSCRLCDFRLLQRSRRDVRSSGLLRRE